MVICSSCFAYIRRAWGAVNKGEYFHTPINPHAFKVCVRVHEHMRTNVCVCVCVCVSIRSHSEAYFHSTINSLFQQ